MRNLLRELWAAAQGFCAAFSVYVALGGFAALALAAPWGAHSSCMPYYTYFGGVSADCEAALAEALWLFGVGVPRGMVLFPTLVFFGLYVWAFENNDGYVSAALTALPHALVALSLMAIGLRDWFARSSAIAYLVGLSILGQMIHLHWTLMGWTGLA